MTRRTIERIYRSNITMEGAGVRLKRAFGFFNETGFDPFLLLDDFGSDNPADYMAGFPWHPHRGIETVTYMIAGSVEHGDSLGNGGLINSGDVQWMTAGGGIIHQEMPQVYRGRMRGFQLWINLPGRHKMMAPRYRGILASEIPELAIDGGRIAVISGELSGVRGPVADTVVEISYFDIMLESGAQFIYTMPGDRTALCYLYDGECSIGDDHHRLVHQEHLIVLSNGEQISIMAGVSGVRALLMVGKPIREPIAWRGPIVMNTAEELETAFREYYEGTFIKTV